MTAHDPIPRRWVHRLAVGAAPPAAFAAVLLLAAAPAVAATSAVQSGWWNEASAGPLAAPSTTPGNELQVSNGLQGPLAFAAVRFSVPSGTSSSSDLSLTLDVPSGSTSTIGTPAVSACPTTGSWKAGGDQPSSSAPGYDCTAGNEANGSVSGTSERWVFPAAWASGSTVSVALVPTPGTQNDPFSQQFDDPTSASVSVLQPSTNSFPAPASPATGYAASPAGAPAPSPSASGGTSGGYTAPPGSATGSSAAGATPFGPGTAAAGTAALPSPSLSGIGATGSGSSPTPTPSSGSASSPRSSAAPAVQQPSAASAAKTGGNRAARIMAVSVLVVTGLALFALAGRPARAPRRLGAFGHAAPATAGAAGGEAVVGGVGRFARPRIGPPKRI